MCGNNLFSVMHDDEKMSRLFARDNSSLLIQLDVLQLSFLETFPFLSLPKINAKTTASQMLLSGPPTQVSVLYQSLDRGMAPSRDKE